MRSLMLGTVAALALAAGAHAQGALVIEGTETAPDDLLGRTVYAAGEGAAGATGELSDVPEGWVPVGVIEELTPPGGGIEIAFAPELMAEEDAVSAKVSAERLRLVPDQDDPDGYFVLLDVTGTPLADVLGDAGRAPMPVAGEEAPEALGDDASGAGGAQLEPDAEVVVIEPEPEPEPEPDDESLREVDITDADAPPIEDATNVVPEGDPGDEAVVPEVAAETELTSPSHTAAMPATGATRPEVAPEEFTLADMSTMDPTELLGVRVYSGDGDHMGEIDRWIGEPPEAAVVDVGGFLGIGDREVAIGAGLLTLMASADGNDLRVYIEMTEAEIEGLPEIAD